MMERLLVFKAGITLLMVVVLLSNSYTQEVHKIPAGGNTFYEIEFDDCVVQTRGTFVDLVKKIERGTITDMDFYPDGTIYFITDRYLVRSYGIIPGKIIPLSRFGIDTTGYKLLSVNEEGDVIVTSYIDGEVKYYTLDVRNVTSKKLPEKYYLPDNPLYRGFNGILPDGKFKVFTWSSPNSYFIWDPSQKTMSEHKLKSEKNFLIQGQTYYFPPCGSVQFISRGIDHTTNTDKQLLIDTENDTIIEVCSDLESYRVRDVSANPSGFRQSPLRIALDANDYYRSLINGYYAYLTRCRKEVPLMGKKPGFFTCGGEIDSISFRLRYYDNPRLVEERIYSEEFPDELKQTSPSRYVWKNPFGGEQDKIREFLTSLRYRVDPGEQGWVEPYIDERVVMTTMHVGSDSTTSWSVFSVSEARDINAGKDTSIVYCPEKDSLDLLTFLSPGADPTGHFDPELSSGAHFFTPGVDQDGFYRYIAEEGSCTDTAIFFVEAADYPVNPLDTVTLCKGVSTKIGFPPGLFSHIGWWNGEEGDSILVYEDRSISREVIVSVGNCRYTLPVVMHINSISGVAGPDTTINYCTSGGPVDVHKVLDLKEEYSYWMEPALSNGNLIFDPSGDHEGKYTLMAQSSECVDTVKVEFKMQPVLPIIIDPVRLCKGEVQMIGIKPGYFDSVKWWNGAVGDSILLVGESTGYYKVSARKDGCLYKGEFKVSVRSGIEFPDNIPDELRLCDDEMYAVALYGLDSLVRKDRTYFQGDSMVFEQVGIQTLTGYAEDCSRTKTVEVLKVSDPGSDFDRVYEMCPDQSVTLELPRDTLPWSFKWKDSITDRTRNVSDTGPYYFRISAEHCVYQGVYSGVLKQNCGDCEVAIPNAVTPNRDGINDELKIFSTCSITITSIELFDKWGGRIYYTNTSEISPNVWNDLSPDVYLVKVAYEDHRGISQIITGNVLVIK